MGKQRGRMLIASDLSLLLMSINSSLCTCRLCLFRRDFGRNCRLYEDYATVAVVMTESNGAVN